MHTDASLGVATAVPQPLPEPFSPAALPWTFLAPPQISGFLLGTTMCLDLCLRHLSGMHQVNPLHC